MASGSDLENQLRSYASAAKWPDAALSTCFAWLRPKDLPIPSRLVSDGCVLSWAASHQAWCEQLQSQSTWPQDYNKTVDTQVTTAMAMAVGNARRHIGEGPDDYPIAEPEIRHIISTWDASHATTPDLLTRAAFLSEPSEWSGASWSLQRLMGPGCLACRPFVWRWRCM